MPSQIILLWVQGFDRCRSGQIYGLPADYRVLYMNPKSQNTAGPARSIWGDYLGKTI